MYDLSMPNDRPGPCCKCRGTGTYAWGGSSNGKPGHTGTCFSCQGTGKQSRKQIARNYSYNVHKIARICGED